MQGFGLMYVLSWKMEAQRKKHIIYLITHYIVW